MTSAAWDAPGTVHGRETMAATPVRRWPRWWRKQTVWRASCACGWQADYLTANDAGRALAQHPQWDSLMKAVK